MRRGDTAVRDVRGTTLVAFCVNEIERARDDGGPTAAGTRALASPQQSLALLLLGYSVAVGNHLRAAAVTRRLVTKRQVW